MRMDLNSNTKRIDRVKGGIKVMLSQNRTAALPPERPKDVLKLPIAALRF